jgi:hypothetical protein
MIALKKIDRTTPHTEVFESEALTYDALIFRREQLVRKVIVRETESTLTQVTATDRACRALPGMCYMRVELCYKVSKN